jgi:N-acetylglucosamine kinase-like BadF-type ATPase
VPPDLIVGLDAGASKLAIRAETAAGERLLDVTIAAEGWEAEPAPEAVAWLLRHLRSVLPSPVAALGLGAQGCDNPDVAAALVDSLAAAGIPAVVVNDAALLVPAAGATAGIGVIAGTGAIAVGATAAGEALAAGGWGWVLSDDAGAVGLVREAVKAALLAHDAGDPDDGLLRALLAAFGVPTAERLARAVNDEPTIENWAPHAPVVFAAADAGSVRAARVVEAGADHLALLVDQLRHRGAVGDVVVAAGGVITRQPRLRDAFAERLHRRHPALSFQLLRDAPVAGAVSLARRLHERRPPG